MTFQLLAPNLEATALAAKKYFTKELGASNFKIETAPFDGSPLRPTYLATLPNKYMLCIEVSEKPFSGSLSDFAARCSNQCLPVKLYVVVPSADIPDFARWFSDAKSFGVGVIVINDSETKSLSGALSFSLFGLHKLDLSLYPKAKRETIRQAQATFSDGDPAMGCQALFAALENVTRKFAIRTEKEGWWRSPVKGEPGRLTSDLTKDPWAKALTDLDHFLEFKKCKAKCKDWDHSLVSQARSMTNLRNLTGHVPGSIKKIIERDKKLRTWFEHAADILKNWYDVTKPLNLKDI